MAAGTDGDFRSDPLYQTYILRAQRVQADAGTTLIREGDTPQNLYLLLSGSLTVSTVDEQGREMVLAWLGPGEFCGEMGLFPDQSLRSAAVTVRQSAWLARMEYDAVRRLATEHPDFVFRLAGQLAQRLRTTNQRLLSLGYLDVAGRIARILLDLCDSDQARKVEGGVQITLTRQELARMAACSREVAGRVLKTLEQEGVIRSEGRRITIMDRPGAVPAEPD